MGSSKYLMLCTSIIIWMALDYSDKNDFVFSQGFIWNTSSKFYKQYQDFLNQDNACFSVILLIAYTTHMLYRASHNVSVSANF